MSSKPRISENEVREILRANKVTDKVCLIGIRGYYQDSIGKRGENDRNVYDDAIIIVSPNGIETFRANTDPSVYRKGVASMTTGVHRYYKGKHKNLYWALRLVGEKVAVVRDGETGIKTGVALNIHRGGIRSTGSLGCQTVPSTDWDDFIEIVYDEMDSYNQETIPYVLIDEKDRRRGAFKMPILREKEVDDLLSRLSEKEPAAQVSKSDVKSPAQPPALNPAPIPSVPPSVSQPQTAGASAVQSVQPNLDDALPSLGGYITQAQQKAAQATDAIDSVLGTVDQIKVIKDALDSRKDGAKSLWATVGQVVYQTFWAVIAFVIGLPLEVWIVVAAIVAAVGMFYIYRQFSLGKVRDLARLELLKLADLLK